MLQSCLTVSLIEMPRGKKTVEINFAPVLFNDAVSAVHVISRVIIGQPTYFKLEAGAVNTL